MWLIIVMLVLLLLPMTAAALVYLVSAAWRLAEALLLGTVAAVRHVCRALAWTTRTAVRATRLAQRGAGRLQDWHHDGSTWAGQYLQAAGSAWANMARRRYVAGQLRRLRRERDAGSAP